MNSGTGNLIGSVSYELASDEACRTKAQHEARPSPSKQRRAPTPSPRQRQAHRKAGPARQGKAAQRGLRGPSACVRAPS